MVVVLGCEDRFAVDDEEGLCQTEGILALIDHRDASVSAVEDMLFVTKYTTW